MPYDPRDFDAASVKLDRFIEAAKNQVGDKYRFGAETTHDQANPTEFDSSELVEWASHQAGFHDMPDGSWNQYRYLHDQGASITVEEALQTKGALVFGFSSDPTASADRPARAYVGISLGNGKVLDVSERAGEVREMSDGGFYNYAAKIPEFHAVDDSVPPPGIQGGVGWSHDQPDPPPAPNSTPMPAPEDNVCYPDDEPAPEDNVCYPDEEEDGPTSLNAPTADTPTYAADTPTYAAVDTDAIASADDTYASDTAAYEPEPSAYDSTDYGDLPVDA